MEKLYNRIDWHNNASPALNETNLNRMSKAVDDIDDRVVDIAGTVMETVPQIQEDLAEAQELIEDAEELTTHPPIIGQNGHWWTWDTSIDDYADSGVDAGVSLSIGETTTLPAGSDATVTNTGTATDPVLNFGIPQGEAGQTGAGVSTGGTTGQVLKKKSGTNYDTEWVDIKQDGITGVTVNRFGECTTQANVNDKYVAITEGTFSLEAGAKVTVKFRYTNTATSPRLKVGNTLAHDIYYRGVRVGSSAPAGVLNGVIDFVYDGTNYNIVGTFVNTTYESKAAESGGTALSLVTTGEKYIWNNAGSGGHTILNGSGSAMNQRSKLQFVGGNVKDDSTNDKTVVTVDRELTQAEYDALSTSEQNNGTNYFITDAPSSYTGVPQSMIGDAWVTSHAYAVGDYSIDANGLYKNGTAHTSTATNRPSVNQSGYWTLVSVASELLKEKFSTSEIVIGKWIDGRTRYRKIINFDFNSNADTTTPIKFDLGLSASVDLQSAFVRTLIGPRGGRISDGQGNSGYTLWDQVGIWTVHPSLGNGMYGYNPPSNTNTKISGTVSRLSVNSLLCHLLVQIEYCYES